MNRQSLFLLLSLIVVLALLLWRTIPDKNVAYDLPILTTSCPCIEQDCIALQIKEMTQNQIHADLDQFMQNYLGDGIAFSETDIQIIPLPNSKSSMLAIWQYGRREFGYLHPTESYLLRYDGHQWTLIDLPLTRSNILGPVQYNLALTDITCPDNQWIITINGTNTMRGLNHLGGSEYNPTLRSIDYGLTWETVNIEPILTQPS